LIFKLAFAHNKIYILIGNVMKREKEGETLLCNLTDSFGESKIDNIKTE